ncbi:MAG: transposase [Flavobacteriales bacterium Tduv]
MEKEIRKIYQKDQRIKNNPLTEEYRYLTMMLLSNGYGISDVRTEELVKKSLSYMRFCGFQLENQIPNHTTLFIISQ